MLSGGLLNKKIVGIPQGLRLPDLAAPSFLHAVQGYEPYDQTSDVL
jgi:hypothetical protein